FGLSFYLFNRSAIENNMNANAAIADVQAQSSLANQTPAVMPSQINQAAQTQPQQVQAATPVANAQQQIMRQAMLQSSSIDNA
ncbi:hypothetical protein, partial [Psychrobacter sp. CAL606-MNA-CIBAN-0158]